MFFNQKETAAASIEAAGACAATKHAAAVAIAATTADTRGRLIPHHPLNICSLVIATHLCMRRTAFIYRFFSPGFLSLTRLVRIGRCLPLPYTRMS